MDNILSQEEIAALVDAVQSGRVRPSSQRTEPHPDDVKPFDFIGGLKITRGRMPTLNILSDRMSRGIRTSLFSILRKSVHVDLDGVKLTKFGDVVESIETPSCLNVFRLPPLRGSCLLVADPELMFALVEQLFGGGQVENPFSLGGRDYSQIELKVISRIVDIILDNMRQVWSRFIDVKPEFLRTEMSLPGANIVGPSDAVITIRYQITVDGTEGPITLIIPDTTIQPIRHLLASPQAERSFADEGNKKNMNRFLSAVSTDVRVLLGSGTISVRELMALKSGDVIQLDTDAQGFLPLIVQGIEKGWGKPVTSRGRFALSLQDNLGVNPVKAFEDEESLMKQMEQIHLDSTGVADVGSSSSATNTPSGD